MSRSRVYQRYYVSAICRWISAGLGFPKEQITALTSNFVHYVGHLESRTENQCAHLLYSNCAPGKEIDITLLSRLQNENMWVGSRVIAFFVLILFGRPS